MSETSSKQAFKQYLQKKKMEAKNLSKADQNELQRLEEQVVIKRIKKRQRYAEDEEYRSKQQERAKITMQKKRASKKVVNVNDKGNSNDKIEIPMEDSPVEQQQPSYGHRFNPRNLF